VAPAVEVGVVLAGEPDADGDHSFELVPNINTNAYRLRRLSSRSFRLPNDVLLPHASDSDETPVEELSLDKEGVALGMAKLVQSVPNMSHGHRGLSLDGFSHDEKNPEGPGESVSRETRTPSMVEEDSAGSIKCVAFGVFWSFVRY
jgi:hypothetical protein